MTLFQLAKLSPLGHKYLGRRSILALGLATALAGCVGNSMPTMRQSGLGDVANGGEILRSGPDYDRIKKVGETILRPNASGDKWQFGIAPINSFGASISAENVIVLTKGLLSLCENDGQVGAILALTAIKLPLAGATVGVALLKGPPPAIDSDVATIRALAEAGYDPRDALQIARNVARSSVEAVALQAPRWTIMENELRRLGYQV